MIGNQKHNSEADKHHMRRALELAARGRGLVEPNPLVGAVVVRDGVSVGEGWHERFGGAHAEVHALSIAGSLARGATLYVTLEPCCHQGKTPPCTDAVIAAGIIRVVAAMKDPFDKVAGQGFLRLQSAGIAVDVAVLEHEARSLNAPYLKLLSSGCPYVHAKWAMTMDGKIATKTGESKWITGEEARRAAHDLRGRMDAIIVGIETVLTDDPSLTARPPGARTATRVVLDSSGRLPIRSQLVQTARHTPVLVVTTDQARQDQLESLRGLGCECLVMPRCEGGVRLMPFLQELGRRRFTNVLVEGGSRVLGSFHDARAIDELHTFVAGKTLGGQGITPVSGEGVSCVGDASLFVIAEVRQIGNDCLIRAYRQQP